MLSPRNFACTAALLAAFSGSIACSSKKSDDNNKPARADAGAKPSPTADAGSAAAADAGFAKLPDEPFAPIGVAECDAYISKQRECIKNAPAGIADQQLDGLAHIATRWRQAAAEGGTEYLVASCKALQQASANATVDAWGCKW